MLILVIDVHVTEVKIVVTGQRAPSPVCIEFIIDCQTNGRRGLEDCCGLEIRGDLNRLPRPRSPPSARYRPTQPRARPGGYCCTRCSQITFAARRWPYRGRRTGPQISASRLRSVAAATFHDAVQHILIYVRQRLGTSTIGAIGHRIVHDGVHLLDNQLLTAELIAEFRRAQPLDLAHLPREIALIDGFRQAFPGIPQIACFDTAFHRNLPRVAQLLPIPRRYHDAGVRRFGFHGLSYTSRWHRRTRSESTRGDL